MIGLHDTGHTAATRMLDSGTTVAATAKWLGHDPAMTLRVYGHVYDNALASAGDVLLGGMPPANRRTLISRRALDGSLAAPPVSTTRWCQETKGRPTRSGYCRPDVDSKVRGLVLSYAEGRVRVVDHRCSCIAASRRCGGRGKT